MSSTHYNELPPDLPLPVDDGAARHLPGLRLPSLPLASTQGGMIDLAAIGGSLVVYCYPMTGRPGVPLPEGWDQIPGAIVGSAMGLQLSIDAFNRGRP